MELIKSLKISDLENSEFSYLKESDFYDSLELDEENRKDEILEIEFCSKYTQNVFLFLNVINLWGVRKYPKELLELVIKLRPFKDIANFFSLTRCLRYKYLLHLSIASKVGNYKQMMNYSAEYGILEGIIFFEKFTIFDENTCNNSAKNGDLNCLKYLIKNNCKISPKIFGYASKNGHLHILKYLIKNNICESENYIIQKNNAPYTEAYNLSIRYGKLECMKFLKMHYNPDENKINIHTCINNNFSECLKLLLDWEPRTAYSNEYCLRAIKTNNINILKILYSKGFKSDEKCINTSLDLGYIEIFKFLYENNCVKGGSLYYISMEKII